MLQSAQLFKEANDILVGGVNSPVRAFKAVGGSPVFMKEGKGAYLYSEDGQTFIDYVLSYGPLILGHAHPEVNEALLDAVSQGTSFGAPTSRETTLGHLVRSFFPSMEKLRFVNSGTEACMSAIRLARGYTRRPYVLKCRGCYHGHVDSLLVSAGSGGLTLGKPDSAGVLEQHTAHTLLADYNDVSALDHVKTSYGQELAAIIVEPVCGNMGVVLPNEGYLQALRQVCDETGALLIFDEVMTGFRVSLNGAQGYYNVKPDITCLGKVVGGGLPCGVYGGRSEVMDHVAPLGSVYQAGTLSGNPLAMAAGIAVLSCLKDESVFKSIETQTRVLADGIRQILREKSLPGVVNQIGSMFSFFILEGSVTSLSDLQRVDTDKFRVLYHRLIEEGLYFAPSPFEAAFMSAAHGPDDIDKTLSSLKRVL